VEPFITLLGDDSADIRMGAARALSKRWYREMAEPLTTILKDKESTFESLIAALEDEIPFVISVAVQYLGEIRDKRAIPQLKQFLVNWDVNATVADALVKLGWSAKTDADKVHFWVANKKRNLLEQNWEITKKVLLKDVESDDSATITYALYAFIAIGKEDVLPDLINKISQKGTKTMAEAYLNCGHNELYDTAMSWANKNGYSISAGTGSNPVDWGKL